MPAFTKPSSRSPVSPSIASASASSRAAIIATIFDVVCSMQPYG
jgi:hypothetical protein